MLKINMVYRMCKHTLLFTKMEKMVLTSCLLIDSSSFLDIRPKKINCFEKNWVGRSVKNNLLHYFFGQKYVFYACFSLIGSWEGEKNFGVGIFLNKNLLG